MSEAADKDAKTEEPTEKRIRDSVEKGQTAFSRELPVLASLLAFTAYFALSGREMAFEQAYFLGRLLEHASTLPMDTPVDADTLFQQVFIGVGKIVAPLMFLLMAAGFAASASQNDPRLVLERIKPKFSRLSLSSGRQRVFGKKGFVEFLKALAKFVLATILVVIAVRPVAYHLLDTMFQHPAMVTETMATSIFSILIAICLAMFVIAAFDLVWSRFSWRRDLRMTKQEIKDEVKQAEGDPMVKARIRAVARGRAQRRMMKEVPTATLIVANPTHFAVALRYRPEIDAAPVVVAKGVDDIALRIREIAEANGVPVFEQVELARSLYRAVKLDQMIPQAFFQAVAELIRIIYERTK